MKLKVQAKIWKKDSGILSDAAQEIFGNEWFGLHVDDEYHPRRTEFEIDWSGPDIEALSQVQRKIFDIAVQQTDLELEKLEERSGVTPDLGVMYAVTLMLDLQNSTVQYEEVCRIMYASLPTPVPLSFPKPPFDGSSWGPTGNLEDASGVVNFLDWMTVASGDDMMGKLAGFPKQNDESTRLETMRVVMAFYKATMDHQIECDGHLKIADKSSTYEWGIQCPKCHWEAFIHSDDVKRGMRYGYLPPGFLEKMRFSDIRMDYLTALAWREHTVVYNYATATGSIGIVELTNNFIDLKSGTAVVQIIPNREACRWYPKVFKTPDKLVSVEARVVGVKTNRDCRDPNKTVISVVLTFQ